MLAGRGEWVTNEKGLVARAGLAEVDAVVRDLTDGPAALARAVTDAETLLARAVAPVTAG